ncbi:MAG: hypothetical protein GX096_02560, partial [Clostridiales bacterium]|nr:hypothetical protein [Clostridiales bacterium]
TPTATTTTTPPTTPPTTTTPPTITTPPTTNTYSDVPKTGDDDQIDRQTLLWLSLGMLFIGLTSLAAYAKRVKKLK